MRYWVKLSVVGIPQHDGVAATEYMLKELHYRRHLSSVRCVWRAERGRAEFEAVVEAPNRKSAVDPAHRDLIAVLPLRPHPPTSPDIGALHWRWKSSPTFVISWANQRMCLGR
jgi:hypothetical protein